jgi:hypothetical protein
VSKRPRAVINGGIHAEKAPSRIRGHFARHLAKQPVRTVITSLPRGVLLRTIACVCKLVYVKMNMHMLPCSLLPIVGNTSSDHVQHEKPESWEDMLSFGGHFDTAHEKEMELAQQLNGVGVRVSDSIGREETEIVDEDIDGDR